MLSLSLLFTLIFCNLLECNLSQQEDIPQCNTNTVCTISCVELGTCQNLIINGSMASELTIECNKLRPNSCSNMTVLCPNKNNSCTITNATPSNIKNLSVISFFGIQSFQIKYDFPVNKNKTINIGNMSCSTNNNSNYCHLIVSNVINNCNTGCCIDNSTIISNLFCRQRSKTVQWYMKIVNWIEKESPLSYISIVTAFLCCFCILCCCNVQYNKCKKRIKKNKYKRHKKINDYPQTKKQKYNNFKSLDANVHSIANNDGVNTVSKIPVIGYTEMQRSNSPNTPINNSVSNKEYTEMRSVNPKNFGFICNSNDINKCEIVDRLITLFICYENWNELENCSIKWDSFRQIFGYNDIEYGLIQLIDDYNHYLSDHDNCDNFVFLCNKLSHIDKCVKNHSYDDIGNGRMYLMNDNQIQLSMEDIFKMEILDKMHLYLMHTNDIHHTDISITNVEMKQNINTVHSTSAENYIDQILVHQTLTNTNTNITNEEFMNKDIEGIPVQIDYNINAQSTLWNRKKQMLAKVHGKGSSKFVTHITPAQTMQYKIEKTVTVPPQIKKTKSVDYTIKKTETNISIDYEAFDDSDDEIMDSEQELGLYCFGRRWYYWKYFEQHKDYISCKYSNFKQELLNNSQYNISAKYDWPATYLKAQSYRECHKGKTLIASGPLVYQYHYGYKNKSKNIEIEHIVSLLFYCNYDKLQEYFSKSFRILDDEQDWNGAKKRNTEFAHWSRLLRESVELFGIKFKDHRDIKLYHGINCELIFESVICKFVVPTSMTTSFSVSESFSDGFGLILQVVYYDEDVSYFDCSWLSNYPTEDEKLLVGGSNSVQLNSIILSRLGHDYGYYIQSIGIIQNMFDGKRNPRKQNKKVINAVNKLIENQLLNTQKEEQVLNKEKINTIPYYVEQFFNNFVENWSKPIIIDIHKFNKKSEYGNFHNILLNNENSWIKIDKICKICLNVQCIKIINGFNFLSETLNKLYDELNDNDEENIFKNLNQIEFQDVNIKCNINQKIELFKTINWKLAHFKNNNNDVNIDTILLVRCSLDDNVRTPI